MASIALFTAALVALLSVVVSQSNQCQYQGNGITASWRTQGSQVQINFRNSNIGNGQWTAIAWGQAMDNLEVVVFRVQNNQATVSTGYTYTFGPPKLDQSPAVQNANVQYNGGVLQATFSRPLSQMSPRNSNLSGCSTWNFVAASPLSSNGDIQKHQTPPAQIQVCPQNC